MKGLMFRVLFLGLLISFSSNLYSQYLLTPAANKSLITKEKKSASNLVLPFFEDFSDYSLTLNSNLWEKSNVFINSDYSYNSISVGVATFDCLDSQGLLYSHANTTGFSADTLTSKSIRLDSVFSPSAKKLSIGDSIILSFTFQPGGGYGPLWESLGATPSLKDSLILQFYDSYNEEWNTVWSTMGMSLDSIYIYDSIFYRFVTVPILDTNYLSKDFRFRFRNYASLDANPSFAYVGNSDHWNIDYIYLDHNRSRINNTFRDITFVESARSMLKKYQAMPARQYSKEEMGDSLRIKISNLFNETLVSIYKYFVYDKNNNLVASYDGGFENITPYLITKSYQSSPNHASPPVNFQFSFDTTQWNSFDIIHTLKLGVGQDNHPLNDTIKFKQVFEDYYAYDDGTAENGFGIEPIRNSNLAVGFSLNAPDTLTAVDIYFNSTYQDANQKPFYLCIWNSNNNLPYDTLYRSDVLTPTTNGLNKFTRYILDNPIVLNPEEFFISLQTKGNDYLNIGFDRNTDASDYIYGNWANLWEKTFIKGSLMIRPYFGYQSVIGLEKEIENITELDVYPNPAKDYINIKSSNTNSLISIINVMGQRVYSSNYQSMIDVSKFEPGVYIISIVDKKTQTKAQRKIIINR